MANNIIQVVLDYRYVDTRSVWQYDYGQILRIQGENLPKAVEVHFSLNEVSGDSITKIGVTTDGITEVQVPDELLENGGARFKYNIYAFVYTEDGASGNTEYRVRIPVQVRPKPSGHVTPDNTDIDPFGDVVKAVNNAAERAEASEQKAKEHAASALKSAVTAEKAKEDALRKVGEKKQEAIEAIQNQEETSVGKITTHTDGEIQRIQNQAVESKAGLEQTIKNADVSKKELDESIQTAGDTKTALDKSTELAGTAKTELDTSTQKASEAKTALDESAKTAGEMQETLSATVKQAGALDTSLGENIETGTQLKTDLTASGEKAVQDIQAAGSEQLGKMQAVAEAFTADREQVATNKEDIGSLKEDIGNLDGTIRRKNNNLIDVSRALEGYELEFWKTNANIDNCLNVNTIKTVSYPFKVSANTTYNFYKADKNVATAEIVEFDIATKKYKKYNSLRTTYTPTEDCIVRLQYDLRFPIVYVVEQGTMLEPYGYTNLFMDKKDYEEIKEDLGSKITKFYASNQGETHLADSDNGKIMDMMLYGRSEQKQYRGKNLLKIRDGAQTTRGVTVTANDGVVALKGTATETGWAIFDVDSFVLDGTYILSSNITGFEVILANKSYITVLVQNKSKTLENEEVSRVCFVVKEGKTYDVSNILIQVEKGSEATSYEPYVGGQPSPSPDYPQEIKSVVNPTVKVTNEDGTKSQTVTLPYTLNAIPVKSGGNYTDQYGQQWVCDEVDLERGVKVQRVTTMVFSDSSGFVTEPTDNGIRFKREVKNLKKTDIYTADANAFCSVLPLGNSGGTWFTPDVFTINNMILYVRFKNITSLGELQQYLQQTPMSLTAILVTPIETPLTPVEIADFNAFTTYYPVTNISVNSEQLDGYTVFNYPISMKNGWDYVKKQLNDNRDYIYDMDAKTQDIDTQSAEAYVNSEYAVALTELEVM